MKNLIEHSDEKINPLEEIQAKLCDAEVQIKNVLSELKDEEKHLREKDLQAHVISPLRDEIEYWEERGRAEIDYQEQMQSLSELKQSAQNEDVLKVVGKIQNELEAGLNFLRQQEQDRIMARHENLHKALKVSLYKTNLKTHALYSELVKLQGDIPINQDGRNNRLQGIGKIAGWLGAKIKNAVIPKKTLDACIVESFPQFLVSLAQEKEMDFLNPNRLILLKILKKAGKELEKNPVVLWNDIKNVLNELTVEEIEILKAHLELFEKEMRGLSKNEEFKEEICQEVTDFVNEMQAKIAESHGIISNLTQLHQNLKNVYHDNLDEELLPDYAEIRQAMRYIQEQLAIYVSHKWNNKLHLINGSILDRNQGTGVGRSNVLTWSLTQLLNDPELHLSEIEKQIFTLALLFDRTSAAVLNGMSVQEVKAFQKTLTQDFHFELPATIEALKVQLNAAFSQAFESLKFGANSLVKANRDLIRQKCDGLLKHDDLLESQKEAIQRIIGQIQADDFDYKAIRIQLMGLEEAIQGNEIRNAILNNERILNEKLIEAHDKIVEFRLDGDWKANTAMAGFYRALQGEVGKVAKLCAKKKLTPQLLDAANGYMETFNVAQRVLEAEILKQHEKNVAIREKLQTLFNQDDFLVQDERDWINALGQGYAPVQAVIDEKQRAFQVSKGDIENRLSQKEPSSYTTEELSLFYQEVEAQYQNLRKEIFVPIRDALAGGFRTILRGIEQDYQQAGFYDRAIFDAYQACLNAIEALNKAQTPEAVMASKAECEELIRDYRALHEPKSEERARLLEHHQGNLQLSVQLANLDSNLDMFLGQNPCSFQESSDFKSNVRRWKTQFEALKTEIDQPNNITLAHLQSFHLLKLTALKFEGTVSFQRFREQFLGLQDKKSNPTFRRLVNALRQLEGKNRRALYGYLLGIQNANSLDDLKQALAALKEEDLKAFPESIANEIRLLKDEAQASFDFLQRSIDKISAYRAEHFPFTHDLDHLRKEMESFKKEHALSFLNQKEADRLLQQVDQVMLGFEQSLDDYTVWDKKQEHFEKFKQLHAEFLALQRVQLSHEAYLKEHKKENLIYREFLDVDSKSQTIIDEINGFIAVVRSLLEQPDIDASAREIIQAALPGLIDLSNSMTIKKNSGNTENLLKDYAGFARIKERVLQVQIEIQIDQVKMSKSPLRKAIVSTEVYQALLDYQKSLGKELNKQKLKGKVTQFSTTQKVFDAIEKYVATIQNPSEYKDFYRALFELESTVFDLKTQGALNTPSAWKVIPLVRSLALSVEGIKRFANDPLEEHLDKKNALLQDLQDTRKITHAFAEQLRWLDEEAYRTDLVKKGIETSMDSLQKKLDDLRGRFENEESEQKKETEEKVTALESALTQIKEAKTLEAIHTAIDTLDKNPAIDVGNQGIFKNLHHTATRLAVNQFTAGVKEAIEKVENSFAKFKDIVLSSEEYDKLKAKLDKLNEEKADYVAKKDLTRAQDTQAKIDAIATFFEKTEKSFSIEDFLFSLNQLNQNPVLDFNRGGEVKQVTDTRKLVHKLTQKARSIWQGLGEDFQILDTILDRKENIMNLFDPQSLEALLWIPPVSLRDETALLRERKEILDSIRIFASEEVFDFEAKVNEILNKIRAFDRNLANAQARFFEENQVAPEERSYMSQMVHGISYLVKGVGHAIEGIPSRVFHFFNQFQAETGFILGENLEPKAQFEHNLRNRENTKTWKSEKAIFDIQEDRRLGLDHLLHHYDQFYSQAEASIFGSEGGILDVLERELVYFVNRKSQYMNGFTREADEHIAQLKKAIKTFKKMTDAEKSALINFALISRLKSWDGKGKILDVMNDSNFYKAFVVKINLLDGESIQTLGNRVGMAPNDPENVLKIQVSADRKSWVPIVSLGMTACGAYAANSLKLKELLSDKLPRVSGLPVIPVIAGVASVFFTAAAFQTLREGVDIPREGPLWFFRKGFTEFFLENNPSLSSSLDQISGAGFSVPQVVNLEKINGEKPKEEEIKNFGETKIPERRLVDPALSKGKTDFEAMLDKEPLNAGEKIWLQVNYPRLTQMYRQYFLGDVWTRRGEGVGFVSHVKGVLDHFWFSQKDYLDKVSSAEKAEFIKNFEQCQKFAEHLFENFDPKSPQGASNLQRLINLALLNQIRACKEKTLRIQDADGENILDKTHFFQFLYQSMQGENDKTLEEVMSKAKMLSSVPRNQKNVSKYPIWKVLLVLAVVAIVLAALVTFTWWLVALPVAVFAGVVAAVGLIGLMVKFGAKCLDLLAELKTIVLEKTAGDCLLESMKTLGDDLTSDLEQGANGFEKQKAPPHEENHNERVETDRSNGIDKNRIYSEDNKNANVFFQGNNDRPNDHEEAVRSNNLDVKNENGIYSGDKNSNTFSQADDEKDLIDTINIIHNFG